MLSPRTLLVLLLTLACLAGRAYAVPLVSARQMASQFWEFRKPQAVEFTGVVTLIDAKRQLVVIQGPEGALGFTGTPLPAGLEPGLEVTYRSRRALAVPAYSPTYPWTPTATSTLERFDMPERPVEAFYSRMRAFVVPPTTGEYRFWLAADDTAELWVSNGASPAEARRVAHVEVWTRPQHFDRSAYQHSDPIYLVAGVAYYLEVVHEQLTGSAHMSVAWDGPGMPRQVIDRQYLWCAEPGLTAVRSGRRGVLLEEWARGNVDGCWRLNACYDYRALIRAEDGQFELKAPVPLPEARVVALEQALSPEDNFRRVRVEGMVSFVAPVAGGIELELTDERRRVRCHVQVWTGGDPRNYGGRRVRLEGVAEVGASPSGGLVLSSVHVPRLSELKVLLSPGSDAGLVPLAIRELLANADTLLPNTPVRIMGELEQVGEGKRILVRDAGSVTAQLSADGKHWRQIGPVVDIALGPAFHAGLVVTSNSGKTPGRARFSELQGLEGVASETSVGAARTEILGLQTEAGYELSGRGHDIWVPPDQFQFMHWPSSGDGSITVRLDAFDATEKDAKAGLMFRDSLEPDAQFIDLISGPGGWVRLQWRKNADGQTSKSVDDWTANLPCWFRLTREHSVIEAVLNSEVKVPEGTKVEVVGYPYRSEGVLRLMDATWRAATPVSSLPTATTWRPLVEIARVNATPDIAASLDVFKVRGVVTFSGELEGTPAFALQDASGGLFLRLEKPGMQELPRVGELVEVQCNPGWKAGKSVLSADTTVRFGKGIEPSAVRHPLEYLMPRRGEGSLVELDAIVRSADGAGNMLVKENGEAFRVVVSATEGWQPAGLVDSRVRLRGVLHYPNERDRVLLLASPLQLEVVEAAPPDIFAASPKPIAELTAERLINKSLHRVRLVGRVTYVDPATLYIEDDSGGARVEVEDALVHVGDQVSCAGFPEMGEDGVVTLANTVVKVVQAGAGAEPLALPEHADAALRARARLVRVQGVVERLAGPRGGWGVRDGLRRHEVASVFPSTEIPDMPEGSLVRLTGICLPVAGAVAAVRTASEPVTVARILLRSPADLVVLQKPRWWVFRRTAIVIGVLTAVVLLGVAWIHRLRTRVAQRTAQLGEVMDKLRREERTAATLAERNRLAGEIHDSLEQGFSGLMLHLESTAKMPDCPDDVRAGLGVAKNMVSFNRAEVQHAVWDLQSPLLENSDLGSALRLLGSQHGSDACPVQVIVEGEQHRLPPATEHHLLRIAQEAITNAVKHAEAPHIDVVLSYAEKETLLSISDTGRGFEPSRVMAAGIGHFGLRSLRGRASKVGGTLSITSAPGKGTTVLVRVPQLEPPKIHAPE